MKYYIQSGSINVVTTAEDAEGAAMWVVHEIQEQRGHLNDFGKHIRVSQQGFCRSESGMLLTSDVVETINQLFESIRKLSEVEDD